MKLLQNLEVSHDFQEVLTLVHPQFRAMPGSLENWTPGVGIRPGQAYETEEQKEEPATEMSNARYKISMW